MLVLPQALPLRGQPQTLRLPVGRRADGPRSEAAPLGAAARALGGSGEIQSVPPGRAARPEAASSVAPMQKCIGALVRREAPSAIAPERPSHPGDERHSAKPSSPPFL